MCMQISKCRTVELEENRHAVLLLFNWPALLKWTKISRNWQLFVVLTLAIRATILAIVLIVHRSNLICWLHCTHTNWYSRRVISRSLESRGQVGQPPNIIASGSDFRVFWQRFYRVAYGEKYYRSSRLHGIFVVADFESGSIVTFQSKWKQSWMDDKNKKEFF